MQVSGLLSLAASGHPNPILTQLWRTLLDEDFWDGLFQRLILMVALLVAAKIILSLTNREIRALARHRRSGYRAATLIEMVQSLIRYVVVFLAVLGGLEILGVPTDHVLTGLGIGGLVMALGAQNLIRDLISGIAILLEDTMGIGDQVIINPHGLSGEVNKMGARIVLLKGASGETHQIAYSSINSVTNLTRH
jgi:small-conductance mechanosensitive channel